MSRAPAPCGTPAGYSRHWRRREVPCDPCRKAHNAASGFYRRRAYVPHPIPLQPCGTKAAYQRHRRAGDPPCETCRYPRPVKPLAPHGTSAARARHRYHGEPYCPTCKDSMGVGGRPRFRGCGTIAGYKHHQRVEERPCEPCREAKNAGRRKTDERRPYLGRYAA